MIKIRKVEELRKRSEERVRLYEEAQGLRWPHCTALVARPVVDVSNVRGILAVRSWRVNTSGYIESENHGGIWRSSLLIADCIPTKYNEAGVYAYVVGSHVLTSDFLRYDWVHARGIVEILGHYELHSDGTIRGEMCKIRGLFVDAVAVGLCTLLGCRALLKHYPDIPITFCGPKEMEKISLDLLQGVA